MTPEPEDYHAVSLRDWKRIRRSISTLNNPIPWMEAAGWASLGIAGSSAVSFVVWLPSYLNVPASVQSATFYVGVVLVLVTVFSFAFGLLALRSNHELGHRLRLDAKHVLEDMDDVIPLGDAEEAVVVDSEAATRYERLAQRRRENELSTSSKSGTDSGTGV